jgi:hypothetical protein
MSISTARCAGTRYFMEIARIISDEKENIKLYLIFWLFYIPASLIIMQFEPANFLIVMLIGLKIILGYLIWKDFTNKQSTAKKQMPKLMQEPMQDRQANPAEISYFDNVFKPDFGKIEYDLD